MEDSCRFSLVIERHFADFVFIQHSVVSAVCYLGVRYEFDRGGFIVGLGGSCCRFQGSSCLLGAICIIFLKGW